jgi:transcriptional regulator with XRE-family HTH domain
MGKKKREWADVIRQAVVDSGLSLNQLGRASAIDSGRLSRFMRGERDLTLASAAKLCEALGLRLTQESTGETVIAPTPLAADLEDIHQGKPPAKARRKRKS